MYRIAAGENKINKNGAVVVVEVGEIKATNSFCRKTSKCNFSLSLVVLNKQALPLGEVVWKVNFFWPMF